VIAGTANAGKSTLFNKILGYERSITYDEPGTTRDIITEKIIFKNNEITIIDSAGIRETKNKVEEIGIKKSEEEIKKADVLIWITGLDQKIEEKEKRIIEEQEKSKNIIVLNKSDIAKNEEKEKYYKEKKMEYLRVSLLNDEDVEKVIKKVEEKIREKEEEIEIPEFIINNRHLEIAKRRKNEIERSIEVWKEMK
jgi:tRNA modification GTPase